MSERNDLPPRRLNTTVAMDWGGIEWLVTLGWTMRGKVAEIFCEGVRAGTHRKDIALDARMRATAHDTCILISYLLQAGSDVKDIYQRLAPAAARQGIVEVTLPCALLQIAAEQQLLDETAIVAAYAAYMRRVQAP